MLLKAIYRKAKLAFPNLKGSWERDTLPSHVLHNPFPKVIRRTLTNRDTATGDLVQIYDITLK